MKRTIIKSVILMVVFVVALFTVSSIMNQGNTDMTTEMGEATLPTLSMRLGAYEVNSLHGYTKEMETASLRDTLLPVDNDRKVVVRMNTYGITVDDIPSIMGTGVDGIALSGAVLNADDPAAMTEKIITAIRQSKNEK